MTTLQISPQGKEFPPNDPGPFVDPSNARFPRKQRWKQLDKNNGAGWKSLSEYLGCLVWMGKSCCLQRKLEGYWTSIGSIFMYHVLFQHSAFELIFYGDKHGIEERWMCLHMIAVPQIEDTGFWMMINCTCYLGATLSYWSNIKTDALFKTKTLFSVAHVFSSSGVKDTALDDQQIDGTKWWCSRVSFAAFALLPRKRKNISWPRYLDSPMTRIQISVKTKRSKTHQTVC